MVMQGWRWPQKTENRTQKTRPHKNRTQYTVHIGIQNTEHNHTEHRTQNTEHRKQNTEHLRCRTEQTDFKKLLFTNIHFSYNASIGLMWL